MRKKKNLILKMEKIIFIQSAHDCQNEQKTFRNNTNNYESTVYTCSNETFHKMYISNRNERISIPKDLLLAHPKKPKVMMGQWSFKLERINEEGEDMIYKIGEKNPSLLPASLPPLTQMPNPWCASSGSLVIVIVLTVSSCKLRAWGTGGDCWAFASCWVEAFRTEAGLEAGVLLSFERLSIGPLPKSLQIKICFIFIKQRFDFLYWSNFSTFYMVSKSKI